MAGVVPGIVVLALGAGALGVPDALRLLIELAGRNPAVDIGICLFAFTILTVQLLGTVLLVRFVRNAPPAAGDGAGRVAPRAPGTDPFACMTLLMSLTAAVLVTACLVLVSGGPGSARPIVDFAATYSYPTVIAAAAATGAGLLYATPLLRALRVQRNARGGAAPAERATTTRHAARFIGARLAAAAGAALPCIASLLRAFREQGNARGRAARAERAAVRSIGLPLAAAICALVVAIPSGARGCLDALRPSPGFPNMPVTVVVGAALLLLVRFYRRARKAAAAAGGDAAPAPGATAPRTRGASAK